MENFHEFNGGQRKFQELKEYFNLDLGKRERRTKEDEETFTEFS